MWCCNCVNGVIVEVGDGVFDIDVVQVYGNCFQYIQMWGMEFVCDLWEVYFGMVEFFEMFDDLLQEFFCWVDIFFVVSSNFVEDLWVSGGVDVSYCGGMFGFVYVEENVLIVLDFLGNNVFNIFGNFLVYFRVGLFFIDFMLGDFVQLVGWVELLWELMLLMEVFEGV